jgi:hypothetical protein
VPHGFGNGRYSWLSEWPYEEYVILDEQENLAHGGVVAMILNFLTDPPDALLLHEVLYVGQAFGSDGDRSAWDRLKSHSTLQRIYSETRPDKEIWLTLCEIAGLGALAIERFTTLPPTATQPTEPT